MDIYKKLEFHLQEAQLHIDRLESVLITLEKLYPLDSNKIESISVEIKGLFWDYQQMKLILSKIK